MLPVRISNPGPLTYESGTLPIALRGPAGGGSSWFKHIYFVLQLYKHTNICDDNTSYGIRTEAKSL